MSKRTIPKGTRFSIEDLRDPNSIEIHVNLHVYLGDELKKKPVLYGVLISFRRNESEYEYKFSTIEELTRNHDMECDHKEIEKKLYKRLDEILTNCSLNTLKPFKPQLSGFLAEYGGGDQTFLL